MERFCINCAHYADAHYSRTYQSPTCTQRGTDSAAFMREFVCGIESARLWEAKPDADTQAKAINRQHING